MPENGSSGKRRDLVAEFCDFHHAYNDISPARRKMQLRALRALEAHVDVELLEVDVARLQSHLAALVDSGLAPATVKQQLNAVRPFYTWAWQRKLLTADRLLEIKSVRPPRVGEGLPRPYNRREVQDFWRDLDAHYPWAFDRVGLTRAQGYERGVYYLARFDRGQSRWSRVQPYAKRVQIEAVVALALMGGLRRDEVFRSTLDQLDPGNDYVVVAGARKNREAEERLRPVPWTSAFMRDWIIAWLDLRERLAPAHDGVWLSLHQHHRLKPMRHRQFEMLLHDIGRGYEFHRMRHTCATEQLRSGTPLPNLSKMLGHTRLEQTLRYSKLLEKDVVDAANRSASRFTAALMPREAA